MPQAWNSPRWAACGLACATNAKPQAAAGSLADQRQRSCLGHLANVLRDAHRAELRPAHRAELRRLEHLLRQRLVVHRTRRFRIERQLELPVPVELEARLGQFVVALPGILASAIDVACVCCYFI